MLGLCFAVGTPHSQEVCALVGCFSNNNFTISWNVHHPPRKLSLGVDDIFRISSQQNKCSPCPVSRLAECVWFRICDSQRQPSVVWGRIDFAKISPEKHTSAALHGAHGNQVSQEVFPVQLTWDKVMGTPGSGAQSSVIKSSLVTNREKHLCATLYMGHWWIYPHDKIH